MRKFHENAVDAKDLFIFHARNDVLDRETGLPILTHGKALTVAVLLGPDSIGYYGTARCHKNDQFNKKIARAIAVGRAKRYMACGDRRLLPGTIVSNLTMTERHLESGAVKVVIPLGPHGRIDAARHIAGQLVMKVNDYNSGFFEGTM